MDAYSQVDRDYDEDRMHQSLDAGITIGRITQLSDDRGLYAPLRDIPKSPNIERDFMKDSEEFIEHLGTQEKIDSALKRAMRKHVRESHPLQTVFDAVIEQVSKGKGEERHGLGWISWGSLG